MDLIARLSLCLPYDSYGESVQEYDLKTRFVLPVLQSLFEDSDNANKVVCKVTNENNLESSYSEFNVSRRRPCGQLRQEGENVNAISIGFMEAKPDSQATNVEVCRQDLARLAVFGKNAIYICRIRNNLLVQVVGKTFTFYTLQKKSVDMYLMVELYSFDFPMIINQIPSIFGHLSQIAHVVDIFNTHVKFQPSTNVENIRPTMRSTMMRSLMTR